MSRFSYSKEQQTAWVYICVDVHVGVNTVGALVHIYVDDLFE